MPRKFEFTTKTPTPLSATIRKARVQRKLSLQELATEVGVSRQGAHHWESGRAKPKAENLHRLADALEIKVEDLAAIAIRRRRERPLVAAGR